MATTPNQKGASINVGEFTNVYIPFKDAKELEANKDNILSELCLVRDIVTKFQDTVPVTIPDGFEKIDSCRNCGTSFANDANYKIQTGNKNGNIWVSMTCTQCTTQFQGKDTPTKNFLKNSNRTYNPSKSDSYVGQDVEETDKFDDIPF